MGGRTPRSLKGSVLLFLALAPPGLEAQGHHDVRWWEAAIAVGIVGATSLFDRGVDAWVQDHRSSGSDGVARVLRRGGQPEVFLTLGGGILVAGTLTRNAALRRRGARVLASVAVGGLTTLALKEVGRVRPADTGNPYVFKPFSRHESFPSGHTTVAFAFAASLAEEIDKPWATALLYTSAAGTGWSRVNDQRHWLSDVLGGAAVGITSAQVIEGRWRVFGLGPPAFLIDPAGTSRFEWRIAF